MLTIQTARGSFQFTRYATIKTRHPNNEGAFSKNKVANLVNGCGVRVSVGDEIKIKGLGWLRITAVSWCSSLDREEVARRKAIENAKRAVEEERKRREADERREIEALSSAML